MFEMLRYSYPTVPKFQGCRLQRRTLHELQLKSNFNLHSHIPKRNEHLDDGKVLTGRT